MRHAVHSNHNAEPAIKAGATILPFDRLRGGDRRAAHLVQLVAGACGVPAILLHHPSRCGAEVAQARQLAMYLMHVVMGRSYLEVGAYFGRDRSTVSHACARIEDKRDTPDFEAFVAKLEAALADMQTARPEAGDAAL